MKWHIMLHFIWVLTVCKSTLLGVSSIQKVQHHVQLFSKSRELNVGLSLHLHPYFVNASSEGSGKSAHLHRLIWALLLYNAITSKISRAGSLRLKMSFTSNFRCLLGKFFYKINI